MILSLVENGIEKNADGISYNEWLFQAGFKDSDFIRLDAYDKECLEDGWKCCYPAVWYSQWLHPLNPEERIDNQGDSCSIPRPAPTDSDSVKSINFERGRSKIGY